MAAIHHVFTVAKYESKTLFRSWFFRIFSILALVFIFVFNLLSQTNIGFPSDDMVALPAKIPFLNLYIINVAQAIIAVFLASEFLKRDKKLDTTEVIYMRSMTNADYVLGKTFGNLWVFFLLNFISLFMVAVFNLISPFAEFRLLPYIYYFLLLSVPTLVYIMGLSFLLMSLVRNQAITFILLLGYIATTLFYLQNKFHYMLDYMAFRLPVTWSDFVGFGNVVEILSHRGTYLFLGIGFIGLTILLLKRLSQSRVINVLTGVVIAISLTFGVKLGVNYLQNIESKHSARKEMLAINDKYFDKPTASMIKCDIELEHVANKIVCRADIEVENREEEPLDEILFTLNPGLEVTGVTGGGMSREKHILLIKPDTPLPPGETALFSIHYKGGIDESMCYLDIGREQRMKIIEEDNTTVDKRHAFIEPSFVLLTHESRWYPTPGVTFASHGLGWLKSSFTDFSLTVKALENLKVISQGYRSVTTEGATHFKPETGLTHIALLIGNYQTRSIVVDSVEYNLHFLEGHNYFDEFFDEVSDSIGPIIKDEVANWEAKSHLTYPFKRFSIVEVPVQFYSYQHIWTSAYDQLHPEMVFLTEGGYKIPGANFALAEKFSKRNSKRTNETESPREKQENFFRSFVSRALMKKTLGRTFGMQISFGGRQFQDEKPNPYYIFPNYYTFSNIISSSEYPIINRVVEAYISQSASDLSSGFMRNLLGVSNDEKGNIALQEKSFGTILTERNNPETIDNVINTKSEFLFSLMKSTAGSEEFDIFFYDFMKRSRFKEVSVQVLNTEMKDKFDIDLNSYLPQWYRSKELPGYLIDNIEAKRVKDGDKTPTMVSFKLTNTEQEPGVVEVTFRFGGRRGGFMSGRRPGDDDTLERIVAVGPKETKRVSFLLVQDPRAMMVNTMSSKNIPAVISHRFSKIEMDEKAVAFDGERKEAYDDGTVPGEIILDNEDPGFRIEKPDSESFLKKLLSSMGKEDEEDEKYKGMIFWNPPFEWTLTTHSQFFGRQVHSAYYIKGGSGDHKAIWNVPLQTSGYYSVYSYIPNISVRFMRSGSGKGEYLFTIYHDDGEDSPVVSIKNTDGGWVDLGSYYFSSDSARIELSNKTDAGIIYADAVKLVKID